MPKDAVQIHVFEITRVGGPDAADLYKKRIEQFTSYMPLQVIVAPFTGEWVVSVVGNAETRQEVQDQLNYVHFLLLNLPGL